MIRYRYEVQEAIRDVLYRHPQTTLWWWKRSSNQIRVRRRNRISSQNWNRRLDPVLTKYKQTTGHASGTRHQTIPGRRGRNRNTNTRDYKRNTTHYVPREYGFAGGSKRTERAAAKEWRHRTRSSSWRLGIPHAQRTPVDKTSPIRWLRTTLTTSVDWTDTHHNFILLLFIPSRTHEHLTAMGQNNLDQDCYCFIEGKMSR